MVDLRDEVGSLYDRAGHELRKEGDIEAEVDDVAHRFQLSSIDVCRVADDLERVKGDAYGKYDVVGIEEGMACQLVAYCRQHVGYFKRGAE